MNVEKSWEVGANKPKQTDHHIDYYQVAAG
jgi:hypothetical protein